MPTHTIASTLVKLWTLGAPWDYSGWQAVTGVRHGLFPEDPALLPKGWTPEDAANVKSYFEQYRLQPTEDDKIAFARQTKGTALPGRKTWRDWVSSLWRTARIHEKIISVLNANNFHPLTLATESSSGTAIWPMGGTWIPLCLDAVASELFGEGCLDHHGRLPEHLRAPTQALIQRTWTNLTKRLDRSRKRLSILEEEAIQAFNDLNDEKSVTKARLRKVIRAVARWRNVAEIFDTPENMQKISDMQAELDCLMAGLGANVKAKSTKVSAPRLFKLSADMLKALSTEEEVQEIISLYHERFDTPANAPDDAPIIDRDPLISHLFGPPVEGADPGTEVEAQMSPSELSKNLGFIEGLPLLFNSIRHQDGLNMWTSPGAFDIEDRNNLPSHISKLKLNWHQLAGVHAIVRACFTVERESEHCTGMLIADEVGLGKTYLAATTIAFLSDAAIRQDNLQVAPILQARPFLAGDKVIPRLPHLILVPGTLISQWLDELYTLYTPGCVDIFVYPSSVQEHALFWAPDGPFHSSRHEMSNRIILAPHSVLQKEFASLYSMKSKKRGSLPWALPPLLPLIHRADITKTLFGQSFLSATLDEAHNFRNYGAKHTAALAILDKSIIRLILLATPLQTATKDLAAMGRMTGILHFLTPYALEEEKEDTRALRRARKEFLEDHDPLDPLEDNDEDPVKVCQVAIAQRMQKQSAGHLLRRAVNSKDWQGNPLIALPPCKIVHVTLDLTPRELEIIMSNGQALKENAGTANLAMKLTTRGFYIEYRLSVIFAREHPNARIPTFKTLGLFRP